MKAKPTILALVLVGAACTTKESVMPPTTAEQSSIGETISTVQKEDPSLQGFMSNSYGYVVFPSIAKGGLIVGGAHGTGWVYEQGQLVGKSKVTQLSVGALAGGQTLHEMIFFKDANAMNAFKTGKFELGAGVSAVMVKEGAAAQAGYNPDGYAIFVKPKGGAMVSAAVGGQKFSYEPISP